MARGSYKGESLQGELHARPWSSCWPRAILLRLSGGAGPGLVGVDAPICQPGQDSAP